MPPPSRKAPKTSNASAKRPSLLKQLKRQITPG
jgi:hypothetical protein